MNAVHYLHGGPGDGWWIGTDMTLEVARETASLISGQIYLASGNRLIPDREWSGVPSTRPPVTLDSLRSAHILDLVRAAGLHQRPQCSMVEAVLLLGGPLVSGIIRRALDLHIHVTYRLVTLTSLFEAGVPTRSCYELSLQAERGAVLPESLLAALDRDPFVLICRRVGDTLLVQHRLASPLPDPALATLPGNETWVFADHSYGCARLQPLGESLDGESLVRRRGEHQLVDMIPTARWAELGDTPTEPAAPELTLVPARMSGVRIDAVLLDDSDLACLPALLVGEPLAEAALLIPGRDRHLLTAPGGLLEQLPVGESLYCLGPGSLYLPLGYRFRPALPTAGRRALFPTDASTAVVVLPGIALRYDLASRTPVWRLWAGPTPPIKDQLPSSAIAELQTLDRELTPPEPVSGLAGPAKYTIVRRIGGRGLEGGGQPRDWRDVAYEAELAGDFDKAAELHIRHNDPLRAARLYERAAERS